MFSREVFVGGDVKAPWIWRCETLWFPLFLSDDNFEGGFKWATEFKEKEVEDAILDG